MKKITELGFAKINLHLDITGQRDDGYHDVVTVMQSLSLCDRVTVSLREDTKITISCDREGVPCDERNLAFRAARLYMDTIGQSRGVHIDIEKHIPMAAGMAGGSADAAAALRAINRLFDEKMDMVSLCSLGARLGADVPFCIVGGCVYADGRGDRLHPFASMPDCTIVAACGGEGVSTPWAYHLLDAHYSNFSPACYTPRPIDALDAAMRAGDLCAVAEAMYNVFEEPVLTRRPVAAAIRRAMLDGGAIGAMMSGSGPSVFGIFDDAARAEAVVKCLSDDGHFAISCHPVAQTESC